MTPSTSLTLQGFLQGLQGNMTGLIGSIVAIVMLVLLAHLLIKGMASDSEMNATEAAAARRVVNRIAGIGVLAVIAGFCINAATYATNAIPRSELDRSSINRDMDVNIKR